MRLSLLNKLALVSFAVTLVAVGTLYIYVAPGLQTRLLDEKLSELSRAARSSSDALRLAVADSQAPSTIRTRVDTAAGNSGDRVSLLSVAHAERPPAALAAGRLEQARQRCRR